MRLLYALQGADAKTVLNAGPPGALATAAPTLAADLRRLANALKGAAYNPTQNRLDYAQVAQLPLYAEYVALTQQLAHFDPATLANDAERAAFWINLYNALVIDAVIRCGVRRSVTECVGFFHKAAYCVGGLRYSADDIENGILRGNRPSPAWPVARPFATGDPRAGHQLPLDPRLHFTLVCASGSCPLINVYDPTALDAQLDSATRTFINNGGAEVDQAHNVLYLSQIFQWYASDFGSGPLLLWHPRPLLAFIARYLDSAADRAFLFAANPRLRFRPYDWGLNG